MNQADIKRAADGYTIQRLQMDLVDAKAEAGRERTAKLEAKAECRRLVLALEKSIADRDALEAKVRALTHELERRGLRDTI